MPLKQISIENFKCFHSRKTFPLGKLTLLTGANSSGKSSILYSILGSIQSGEFPFKFSTNGKYVNMGDFKEIAYNQNRKEKIHIDFTFEKEKVDNINTTWIEDPKNNLPKLYELKANAQYFDLRIKRKTGVSDKYIIDFEYWPENDPQNKFSTKESYKTLLLNLSNFIFESRHGESNKVGKVQKNDLSSVFEEITKHQNIKGLEIKNLMDDALVLEKGGLKLHQIFDTLQTVFSQYDKRINFISSFRLHPDRGYLEKSKAELKVSNDGNGYLDQIISWETNEKVKIKNLISTFNDLGLLDDIQTKRSDGGKYDILVKTKSKGVFSSLYDVGFGISQFLPIIVADLQLPRTSQLYIAQPEIHLHPSIQASFGDYLTKQIADFDKKYVIETHSEYLLNRVRLAIVKGEIEAEDVKIYYVESSLDDTNLHEITFTNHGQIVNAPEGFFKTYMMDVMDIAINSVK
jgi:predicted ATPase